MYGLGANALSEEAVLTIFQVIAITAGYITTERDARTFQSVTYGIERRGDTSTTVNGI